MYDRKPFASGVSLNLPEIKKNATERISEFDVRTGSAATPAGTLSGGNQQKVILARELGREHKVLIASQPTRASTSGPFEFVHRGSSSSATTASRSSSSPPSSMRSTPWRTGSVMYEARSPASATRTCPRPSSGG